jgi:transposase
LKTPIDGVESLSWALSEREHYVKTAKDAVTRLKSLLVTAPVELRDSLKELKTRAMLNKVASWRPGTLDNPVDSFKHRARSLARSALDAYEESARIMKELDGIVLTLCPSLRGITGIGPWGAAIILTSIGWQGPEFVPSEANLASFSGTAPIPASSGKTDRHRLNRGGNRQLNSVLYTAVLSQMRFDPEVKAWIEAKQSQPGKTKKDAIRASKRHLVRVVRRALLNPTGDLIIAT